VKEWPKDWDERLRGKGCAMCADGRPDDNGFGLRVLKGRYADAYLQRVDSGQPGYTIVIWRGRHVAEPTQLSAEEAAGYFAELLRVGRAIEHHYRPLKLNYDMLGNSLPHMHTHVVPRYQDDGAPGTPSDYMRHAGDFKGKRPESEIASEAAALKKLLA
jgi:diadenosine tetraphosphate (Ap4A) HIT family hydrolase